jgi:hypothetical protein
VLPLLLPSLLLLLLLPPPPWPGVEGACCYGQCAQEAMSAQLSRIRFDLILSLLATNLTQPPERAEALAQVAAAGIAQTINWEQREQLKELYAALQRRVGTTAAALRNVTAAEQAQVGFLELWNTITLSDLWVMIDAFRGALTHRQRAILAALYRDFFPDPIDIVQRVHLLCCSSPPPCPPDGGPAQ